MGLPPGCPVFLHAGGNFLAFLSTHAAPAAPGYRDRLLHFFEGGSGRQEFRCGFPELPDQVIVHSPMFR